MKKDIFIFTLEEKRKTNIQEMKELFIYYEENDEGFNLFYMWKRKKGKKKINFFYFWREKEEKEFDTVF